ncbi:MAG: undecaprenyl-diphosphate phosphatase [Candidatus Omnitrophica bacterium]|nr:undecaprenyl-diphosphate phosphatase [Candidatus Omnitrophota bacterium]MCM8810965.1 undecaprenyl-diphosphate phosphatase [Candidatus Omnitrophota bacterium]
MIDIVILSVIQGICEWFPISSSGHLYIFHRLLGLKPDISLDIFLHSSALCAIFIFFRKEILKIIKVFFTFDTKNENFKTILYIISATFITGIIGFFLKDYEGTLENKNLVSAGFLITSIFLFLSKKEGKNKIDFKTSLIIGLSQGLALLPGISRSGATISTAKILGVNDKDSFDFSFLLAIPAIIGAIIIKFEQIKNINSDYIITGFLISFFVSIITLYFLKKIFLRKRFQYFCIYTFLVFLFSLFI